MITIQNVFLGSLLGALCILSPVFGAETVSHTGEAIAFYIENDTRNIGGPGSDQSYSNGLKFSYIYAEDKLPTWSRPAVDRLQIIEGDPNKTKLNFGISLGHQIYTPNNTGAKSLVSDDRPYAGWLYLGFAASFREENSGQSFEMDLGMVGPSALGKEVQNNFHDLIHDKRTQGWSNGLHDEPTLQFAYQHRRRILRSSHFDIVPYYGAGLGNILVGAHVGALIRVGVNLPDDLGPSRPSSNDGDSFVSPTHTTKSVKKLGYYGFAGARGNAVARSIFLDGNTFQESHHVKKYPFNFDTEFGFAAQFFPLSLVWRFVTKSPEFEQRSVFVSFASVNFIYAL